MAMDRIAIARGFVARLEKVGAQKAVKELAALVLEYRLHSQVDEILADIPSRLGGEDYRINVS